MISATDIPVMAAAALLSYLLGSLNFAIIISRLYARDDVRRHGSGNAGMTNILRTYGKGPAIGTALGDFGKAIAAIFISRLLFYLAGITLLDAGYLAGLFVLLGHLFPLYFRFKGGKGVMTTLGIVLATNPLVFLILAAVFIPLVFIVRIVSLVSILGAVCFPITTWIVQTLLGRDALWDTVCAAVIGLIIIIMHRENIRRLLNGTENRFGTPKQNKKDE